MLALYDNLKTINCCTQDLSMEMTYWRRPCNSELVWLRYHMEDWWPCAVEVLASTDRGYLYGLVDTQDHEELFLDDERMDCEFIRWLKLEVQNREEPIHIQAFASNQENKIQQIIEYLSTQGLCPESDYLRTELASIPCNAVSESCSEFEELKESKQGRLRKTVLSYRGLMIYNTAGSNDYIIGPHMNASLLSDMDNERIRYMDSVYEDRVDQYYPAAAVLLGFMRMYADVLMEASEAIQRELHLRGMHGIIRILYFTQVEWPLLMLSLPEEDASEENVWTACACAELAHPYLLLPKVKRRLEQEMEQQ